MTSTTDPYAWVEAGAELHPERLFLETPAGAQLTYAMLAARCNDWAAALTACGVVAGDRVAAQIDKSPEAVLLYLACLRLGAVYVPINTANTRNEVDYFLRDAAPRLVIVRPDDARALESLAGAAGVSRVESLGTAGDGSLAALGRAMAGQTAPRCSATAATLAAIIYTSGTTGRSKGAMLTRGNLASNAVTLASSWCFTSADRLLHVLPLFHVHGLFVAINTILAAGAGLRLMAGFDAAEVLRQLRGVTVFMGVPTHYTRLLQLPGLTQEAVKDVRLFVSGSAPLHADTHREFLARTGQAILERYGMTETLMNTSNPYAGPRLAGYVGPPLPGIEVRIAAAGDATAGDTVVGEIEMRGPNVFAGYWGDAAKTRAAFSADGWFRSGDLGCFNATGSLQIVGRARDLVISGGYNVYPKEIEAEIDALPGVLESAVIGVPHPDFGEGVTALVVPEAGAQIDPEAVITALQLRLARYKLPKRVLILAQLPRNAMGKVQKNVLREQHAGLYQKL